MTLELKFTDNGRGYKIPPKLLAALLAKDQPATITINGVEIENLRVEHLNYNLGRDIESIDITLANPPSQSDTPY